MRGPLDFSYLCSKPSFVSVIVIVAFNRHDIRDAAKKAYDMGALDGSRVFLYAYNNYEDENIVTTFFDDRGDMNNDYKVQKFLRHLIMVSFVLYREQRYIS